MSPRVAGGLVRQGTIFLKAGGKYVWSDIPGVDSSPKTMFWIPEQIDSLSPASISSVK